MVLDSLDGRVARLTNTQSAPLVPSTTRCRIWWQFGLAPAVLAYEWALSGLGMSAHRRLYLRCLAPRCVWRASIRRSARWTSAGSSGWPVRLQQVWVAGWVCGVGARRDGYSRRRPAAGAGHALALMVAAAGLLMVSNIKYYSFKDLDLKGRVPFCCDSGRSAGVCGGIQRPALYSPADFPRLCGFGSRSVPDATASAQARRGLIFPWLRVLLVCSRYAELAMLIVNPRRR